MRSRDLLLSSILISLLALLILLCSAYLLRPSIRARYLFSKLETLELGHSTFEDAQRLAKKIGAEPYGSCNRSTCEWDAKVDNARLPQWWRGSGETFSESFSVKDSVVVRTVTGFGIGTGDAFHPSHVALEEQEHWGRGNTREPVQAGWYTTELFRYWWFPVRMTPKRRLMTGDVTPPSTLIVSGNRKVAETQETCCQQRTDFPLTNEHAKSRGKDSR